MKRYGLLYSDGSFNISSAGEDLATAKSKLCYSSADDDTELVEVEIKVVQMFGPKLVKQVMNHIDCPTCGECIEIKQPQAAGASDE